MNTLTSESIKAVANSEHLAIDLTPEEVSELAQRLLAAEAQLAELRGQAYSAVIVGN